jgi:hypothetical protein
MWRDHARGAVAVIFTRPPNAAGLERNLARHPAQQKYRVTPSRSAWNFAVAGSTAMPQTGSVTAVAPTGRAPDFAEQQQADLLWSAMIASRIYHIPLWGIWDATQNYQGDARKSFICRTD